MTGPGAKTAALRVLAVNIFFAPRRFGGATLVAEEMAHRLAGRADTEVAVFTTAPAGAEPPYRLLTDTERGVPVYTVTLPGDPDGERDFEHPAILAAWRETLQRVQPDVAHIHCLQGMGVELLDACVEAGIPFAVTLHDAWWICGRQFMVTGQGRYCHQTRIDLNVCSDCVAAAGLNAYRQLRLRQTLMRAELLMAPSAFFRSLYMANGFPAERLVVNRNGVNGPGPGFGRRPSPRLRFGYVGGDTPIKGAPLVKAAFARLDRRDYELVVVDNTLALGRASIFAKDWPVGGQLTVLAPYTPETLDEVFAGIDVLLFPSQWKESFGLTVREALLRDIWVVATDAGGAVEDLAPGENGDILPLDADPEQLARVLDRLLDSKAALARHVNPHKGRIGSYAAQAEHLRALLAQAAARDRSYPAGA